MRGDLRVYAKMGLSVVVVLLVMAAAFFAGTRLIGLTPYIVLSGSMEPEFPVGSLIYVRKVLPESVTVGDPITFTVNEGLQVVTHRIVAVESGQKTFITKGDANSIRDGKPVDFSHVLGMPVLVIPYLGYLASEITKMVRSPWIIATTLVVGYYVSKRRISADYQEKARED